MTDETSRQGDRPGNQREPGRGEQRPSDSRSERQEWIVTTDKASGQVVKVERLDLGQREELSAEEYALLAASAPLATAAADVGGQLGYPDADLYAAYSNPSSAYYEAYSQGVNDALRTLAASYGSTPEEQAYYLGMMPFAASLG